MMSLPEALNHRLVDIKKPQVKRFDKKMNGRDLILPVITDSLHGKERQMFHVFIFFISIAQHVDQAP
jgi:hypothetical protein